MRFGPEIKVDGKRPFFVGDKDAVLPKWRTAGWDDTDYEGRCVCGWDESIVAIRLHADHKYYLEVANEWTGLNMQPVPTPTRTPLEDRMVALIRKIGSIRDGCDGPVYSSRDGIAAEWEEEAVSILAELEPVVDPDIQLIAEAMARVDSQDWSDVPDACRENYLEYAKAIRGRQLEKEGK